MSRIYLCLLLSAALLGPVAHAATRAERGNVILDDVPDVPSELADRLDAYLYAREAVFLGWSPQGQLLIATRFGDTDQLHLVDKPGGERRQLSFFREPIGFAAFSPDPGRGAFVFSKDAGGDERAQLYYQRTGEAAARMLTDGKSVNGGALWSNTGREVAFYSTARDGSSVDIVVAEPQAGTLPHLVVTGDDAAWIPLDWSPDDRKLLVLKSVSMAESYLYVVDLASGQKREVEPSPGRVAIAAARFSRDGQGVYLISDRDADFAGLRYVNLFTGDKKAISGGIPWNVESFAISRDGHYLAFVHDENGTDKLSLQDLRTHRDLFPPRMPYPGILDHLSFDPDGTRLAFDYSAVNQPRDAYVLDIAANRVDAWTHSEAGPVDPSRFVLPHLASFPTFDRVDGRQRQEPVYVYEPATAGPHPVLLLLHGGPEAQFRPRFDPWIQFVVNELGMAVVAPNLRGSSGYGKNYLALDNGTLRDDAVKDVGALIVWLGSQPGFDAKRVIVAGGSYGGFLSLAALANYGDRLLGGVDFAGIADFVNFLTDTTPPRRNGARTEYGDERDPDQRAYLRRISPLTNADRIARPLLVVHGRNDPWILASQSEQLVNRLRSRGGEVWYLQAKDEGHAFRRKPDRDEYYRTFAAFLQRRLKGG